MTGIGSNENQGIGAALLARGGNIVNPIQWDDFWAPANGARLDTSSGRLDFNYSECYVEFATNARYPDEPVCFITQMPHTQKLYSEIRPHIHWTQTAAGSPNWLLAYRIYGNNSVVPSFSLSAGDTPLFTYPGSGDFAQITEFDAIDTSSIDMTSCIVDFILYRDSANTSTLFAGADTYAATANLKEFDFHYQKDSAGSNQEYIKQGG